jgi:dihydropyrimidinase
MSRLIRGGRVVTATDAFDADVLIEGESIVAIGTGLEADEEIDASGCLVMPGLVDNHTHLSMPFGGTWSCENYDTGTASAAAGGTTALVDFCIQYVGGSLKDALAEWHGRADGQAHIDYGFHMAITDARPEVVAEMADCVNEGITSFKVFMAYKGALMVDDEQFIAVLEQTGKTGGLVMVHCENGDAVVRYQKEALEAGDTDPKFHASTRPPEVEGEATNRAIMIADMAGVPLYVVHTSCEQSHEAIRRARAKGMRVFGEPLIQHLVLDETEYQNKDWDYAARRVMSPPFRNKQHQDSLWAGLAAGSLQVVATDHCAFTTAQKRVGVGNFAKIPNGTGGLEERMPLLWTFGVNTGRLTKEEVVAVTSTNSAKILNL